MSSPNALELAPDPGLLIEGELPGELLLPPSPLELDPLASFRELPELPLLLPGGLIPGRVLLEFPLLKPASDEPEALVLPVLPPEVPDAPPCEPLVLEPGDDPETLPPPGGMLPEALNGAESTCPSSVIIWPELILRLDPSLPTTVPFG